MTPLMPWGTDAADRVLPLDRIDGRHTHPASAARPSPLSRGRGRGALLDRARRARQGSLWLSLKPEELTHAVT
jgi:hypothetical protein